MNCNCKWTEIFLVVLILVFTIWSTAWSFWIVVIAAALLLIHAIKPHPEHYRSSGSRSKKRKR